MRINLAAATAGVMSTLEVKELNIDKMKYVQKGWSPHLKWAYLRKPLTKKFQNNRVLNTML